MAEREIDAIRALLTGEPRPVGRTARRTRLDEVGAVWPVAEDVTLEAVNAGGPLGEVSIVPGSDPSKVVLFFHGGGYCSGSIVSHRRMVTEAGRACGARTLAVGYRLAPENPFPAALDDALAAWRFLRADGIGAPRIHVGGDSAGAGLTLALMQRLREAGEALPACAWLFSPWTDLTMSGDTLASKDAVDPLIHKSRGVGRRLSSGRNGPQGPADLTAVRRPRRPAAPARPGRLRGDAARRCDPVR